MVKINTYGTATPVLTDKILGTDVSDTGNDANGETVNFLISALQTLFEDHFAKWTATINAQSGTTYTLVLADAEKRITTSNGGAVTITVPTNASVAFPTGTEIIITQVGAGAVTVDGATGVTVNGVSGGSVGIQNQYQSVALLKVGTDTWVASGDI